MRLEAEMAMMRRFGIRVALLGMATLVGCAGKPDAATQAAGGRRAAGGATSISSAGTAGSTSAGAASDSLAGAAGVPATTGDAGSAGSGATGGIATAGSGSADAGRAGMPSWSTSCDEIGVEPAIPAACATVLALKTSTAGVLDDDVTLDTALIQAAIDACPAGQAVKLAVDGTRNAFVSGPIMLRKGVTLWIDAGAILYASHNPRDFDARATPTCGTRGSGSSDCRGLINATGVSDASVMGAGTIDGRGAEATSGDTRSWWALNVEFGGQIGAPRLVQTNAALNFTLYQLTLRNAPKFHVVIAGTNGFKVWGITINTPADAPNSDGVDPQFSMNGVIAYNKITTGDDNIAIKGTGVTKDIIIAHNHFGRGHGMSIGSETYGGVSNVRVCDLSLDGTDNGLRIKSDRSKGGLVQGIFYKDVCIRNVKHPLVFDTTYSDSATGTLIPVYQDIVLKNVRIAGTGSSTFAGYDAARPLKVAFDNVVFDNPAGNSFVAQDANITRGPGPVNFVPVGTNVTVVDAVTNAEPPIDCENAWVTF